MTTTLLVLLLTNSLRHTPVSIDPNLSTRAQHRAELLCAAKQWSHDGWMASFRGTTYRSGGENLARNYPSLYAVFGAWMQSPTHLANIQNANFRMIGVGYDPRCNLYVELFGGV